MIMLNKKAAAQAESADVRNDLLHDVADTALARAAARGDRVAWRELMHRYDAPMRYHMRSVLRKADHDITEEVLHDLMGTFYLRLVRNRYKRLRQFDPKRTSFRRWLRMIARQTVINFLSKAGRSVTVDLDANPDIEPGRGGLWIFAEREA